MTADHIGLLIFETFNCSIPRSNIEGYEYDVENSRWGDINFEDPFIELGTSVTFMVTAIEARNGVVSINGKLDGGQTGPVI